MQVKKNKKYSNASGLLNFQFDRPVIQSPPVATRKYHKPIDKRISKAQFLQANFRFNVSPLTNPLEQSLYDPDIIVPWDIVESVVVPMSEDNTLVCPVCLDLVRIPKMTKCGHTFCYTCILHHMSCLDRSNRFKCPLCSEVVCEGDLKSVQYVAAPSSTGGAGDTQQPQVDQRFSFQHVELHKGSLCPRLPFIAELSVRRKKSSTGKSSSSTGGKSAPLHLSDVIPSESAPNAAYCRIVHLSVPSMRRAFESEQRELTVFQYQCLHEHNAEGGPGDVETLPFVAEALRLLATRAARFDEKVTQATLSGLSLSGMDDSTTVSVGRVSGSRMTDRVGSSDDLSSIAVPTTPIMSAQLGLSSSAAVFVPGGSQSSSVTASNCNVTDSDGTPTSNKNKNNGGSGDSSVSHVYQSGDGELVFLLPLCTKCLLDGAAKGDPNQLPSVVTGRVLEVERLRVTSDVRQRYAFLRHLPLQVVVLLVEVDLLSTDLVSKDIIDRFSEELSKRVNKRKERLRSETRERRMEEDKRVAEDLARRDRLEFYRSLRRQEQNSLRELRSGPAVGEGESTEARAGDVSISDSVGEAVDEVETLAEIPVRVINKSFATITQMGGHFPVLLAADPFPPCASSSSTVPNSTSNANRATTAWGAPGPVAAMTVAAVSTESSRGEGSGTGDTWTRGAKAGETDSTSSSKSKKGAKFSLLSNSSGRSYR